MMHGSRVGCKRETIFLNRLLHEWFDLLDFLAHVFASAQQLFRFDQNFGVFLESADFFASQVLQHAILTACHLNGFHDFFRFFILNITH